MMKKNIICFLTLVCSGLSFSYAETEDKDADMIIRGGQIYDRYYVVTGAPKPEGNSPSYANEAGKYDGANSWRCKECHGWDYVGKEGRYSAGSHFTGIKGIEGAKDKSVAEISAMLRDKAHGYTEEMISDSDMEAVAKFVQEGQFDMYKYIDKETGEIIAGSMEVGKKEYDAYCSSCHGKDGKMLDIDGETMGSIALGNPPETLHKILFGHPAAPAMPPMYKKGLETSSSILKYMSSMP